jgi:hypothetical protein
VFNAEQMNIIWHAANNTRNKGDEVAVFNRINDSLDLRGHFDDVQLNIIKYCAEECKRQYSGNMSVYNLVDAWTEAISFVELGRKVTLDMIERFGILVEPQKNKSGYRSIRIGVGNGIEWIEKAPPDRVIPQLKQLIESYYDGALAWSYKDNKPLNPLANDQEDQFYYEYEEIHPFVDGNGRTGKIIYNYLKGTLLDPQMPPDFYGVGNP